MTDDRGKPREIGDYGTYRFPRHAPEGERDCTFVNAAGESCGYRHDNFIVHEPKETTA